MPRPSTNAVLPSGERPERKPPERKSQPGRRGEAGRRPRSRVLKVEGRRMKGGWVRAVARRRELEGERGWKGSVWARVRRSVSVGVRRDGEVGADILTFKGVDGC